MNKKHGNVSLLILFILIASSLIGLLTVHFVNNMFSQVSMAQQYYRSYYLAKGGMEFGLSLAHYRGVGFTSHFGASGDRLLDTNFLCSSSTNPCHLDLEIQGKNPILSRAYRGTTGCDSPMVLGSGDAMVIPLFADAFSGDFAHMYDVSGYTNLGMLLPNSVFELSGDSNALFSFGMLVLSGGELHSDGLFFRTGMLSQIGMYGPLSTFSDQWDTYVKGVSDSALKAWKDPSYTLRNYFLLTYLKGKEPVSFCVKAPQENLPATISGDLPMQKFFIHAKGSDLDQLVSLEGVYDQPIPGFLIDSSFGGQ